MRRLLLFVAGAAAACSQPTTAPPLRHLDRPTDVAFGCIGFNLSGAPEAMTAASCGSTPATADAGPSDGGAPDAAEGLSSPRSLAFIVEPVRGDLSVADVNVIDFVDSDRFAPGLNGLPLGRLPTSVAVSTDGCHAVVSNAGSCNLSLVNVAQAYLSVPGAIRPIDPKNSAGLLHSSPTMVTTRPGEPSRFGSACTAEGSGSVYVAFESCHLVARVDLATGMIIDGVHSPPGGAPVVVGPEITCPADCDTADALRKPQEGPDAGLPDAGAPAPDAGAPSPGADVKPSALALDPDGTRLYAGSASSGQVLVVDLDATGRPTAAHHVALEGAGSVKRVAASGPLVMGNTSSGPVFSFVYAIADDGAVHVVDVSAGRSARECDTQIDRRYLKGGVNRDALSCFPVGRADNPPRRADARGPGVRLPGDVLPLDVAFLTGTRSLGGTTSQPTPRVLGGTFAMISAVGPVSDARNRGLIYVINVDDDNYDDVEGNTASNDINLGLPHSLRDNNLARHVGVPVSDPPTSCAEPSYNNGNIGPVRLSNLGLPTGFFYADTGVADSPFAPNLHRVQCGAGAAVYELSVVAGQANRDTLFPDLGRIGMRGIEFGPTPTDEEIVVAWEGVLTHDPVASQRRGGRLLRLDSSRMDLQAPGGLLCSLGAEDGDILRLVGCNADVDCAEGIETCVVHPEQPQGLNGLCMPRDRANDLTARCRDLLVTARVFTLKEVAQGRALLLTRPAVLPASPIEGCTDAGQCSVIEDDILDRTEMVNGQPNGTFPRHMYVCEVDPGMGGPPRCIPSCTTDADCQSGSVCAGERCVLAPIPAAECVSSLQRYEVRAGDAFMILSSTNSFKHRQMVDPQSGRCVENTTLSPLIANRVRRMEPECGDLSGTTIGPNPCTRTDLMEPLLSEGTLGMRPAYGMRIRSPGVTFDITDVAFRNAAGGNALVSTIPSGHFFTMTIAGGFQPMTYLLTAPLPERLRPAPDGSLWIVDSGDSSASLTRGQLLFMTQDGVSEVRLR